MHLVWFELHGFKRFASPTKLHVDGKLVAIVGPNEGGKTTLLQAFQHLNNTNRIRHGGPSQETTRGESFDPEHEIFEATYFLDDGDKAAIKHIPEAAELRWYAVIKRVEGDTFDVTLKPKPKRNLAPRAYAAAEIGRNSETLSRSIPSDEGEEQSGLNLETLKSHLSSDAQTLGEKAVLHLSEMADAIEVHCKTHGIQGCEHIPELLRTLSEHEALEHPSSLARKELYKRLPRFLRFTDADRLLESQYDLNSFFKNEQGKERANPQIPKAMQNITAACNLNLRSLFDARVSADEGKIESLLDDANEELKKLMNVTWSQSSVTVRLRLNQYQLHVLVGARGEPFVQIAERSDGLRQFVALLMFLSHEPNLAVPPVILIDEAERHLHYDAQADLMQMLARQDVAAKVIYTTHSMGCLPEDLGTGVRLVEQIESNQSKVTNWFWESDTPGFSRLLFGMGANTLAFIPIRFAVLTEGAADLLLLPSLLKSASNVTDLGFQVAPGLSSATSGQLAVVDQEAPRTVFLVDSDDAGLELRNKILEAGISEDRVLSLPKIDSNGAIVEDFVDADSYVRAVNLELKRSHGDAHSISVSEFGNANRAAALEGWCKARNIKVPSKRAVAYHIIETRHEHQIVANERLTDLQQLLAIIKAKFEDDEDLH